MDKIEKMRVSSSFEKERKQRSEKKEKRDKKEKKEKEKLREREKDLIVKIQEESLDKSGKIDKNINNINNNITNSNSNSNVIKKL